VAKGQPDKPWTRVTLLNEGGIKPEAWIQPFAQDPAEPAPQK
jgi:hypothetical protein